jgi:2-hydroxy-3-keto-5-methylthiopentenyl-1-phosphate phosphatase
MSVAGRVAVFADFDDTLTMVNVAQHLLRRFAPEALAKNSALFRNGEITFREYQERAFDAVTVPVTEMQAIVADEISLRDGAVELVDAVAEVNGTFTVASAGLRLYIEPVLQRHGLGHVEIVCGTAIRNETSDGPISESFRYDYPFVNDSRSKVESCEGDWATCKCKALEQAGQGVTTIFVGDGSTSDACVAPKADHVFARDRLLDICNAEGINATPFENLHTVSDFVKSLADSTTASQARSKLK